MADAVAAFFRACEDGNTRTSSDQPAWLEDLAAAAVAELAFDVSRARGLLERARRAVPAGPFRNVLALLEIRVAVRAAKAAGVAEAVDRLEQLVASLTVDDHAVKARALHLLAIARMRLGRVELAEQSVVEALTLVSRNGAMEGEEGGVRLRMADTMAQLLIGQGAWTEATRTLLVLVGARARAGDALGVAISAGHLSRLYTQLGRPAEGLTVARDALAGLGPEAPRLTRLRLHTLMTNALLDLGDAGAVASAARALEALVEQASAAAEPHYLRGYAMMALARACAVTHDMPAARRWLERAASELTLPAHVALLRYHEARVDPRVTRQPEWRASFERLVAASDFVSEAEVKMLLLLAEHALEDGDRAQMRAHLGAAHRRAMQSNNPLSMRWVDEVTVQLDPEQQSEHIALRFSGRSRHELQRTTREDVTIIFADLVSFTPRTLELEPEEVMDTVRGLFELGVPLLSRHRVTPISYMGDGLLALCQGEGHQRRGIAFARELVARAGRVGQLRRAIANGWPVDLRAGVASGPVVLGTLGTLFKTEFAAIGVATNLAARLQSKAEPGEVMCSGLSARAAGIAFTPETMKLKGFEKWDDVEVCRLRVYTPGPA